MTHGKMRDNGVKGLMLLILLIVLATKSSTLTAQSTRIVREDTIASNPYNLEDSVLRLLPAPKLYKGLELSMGFPNYLLKSNIAQLNGLHVNYIGTNVGTVLANPFGKVKANIGAYWSEPSVPYTMNMLQGGISGSIYLLRLKKVKYHSFEPYVVAGLVFQQTKYYGTYLLNAENASNYSAGNQPVVGKTGYSQLNAGLGVEYQLVNDDNQFIHVFTELSYGMPLFWSASNQSLSGTRASNPATISMGINFGICK
jgi:hypothetical protein